MICGLGLGRSKDEYQASNIPFMNRGERADVKKYCPTCK
jgi:hypothetical protein